MIKIVSDFLVQTQKRFPDKLAYVSPERSVTFTEALDETRHVATGLLRRNLFHRPVVILLDKGVNCILSMLGIGMSGNIYTVLDTEMPDARIQVILDTLKPAVMITSEAYKERALTFEGEQEVVLYKDLAETPADLDALAARRFEMLASDVLYVMFTSGSTGVPKGVTTQHSAIISYLEWAIEFMETDDTLILVNQVPFYFVASTFDVYSPIIVGSTTHIVPKLYFAFPMMLLEYMKENKANILWMVTSMYIMIANMGLVEEFKLDNVKFGCFGGEVMPAKVMNQWVRAYPGLKFYNMWGATETTDWGTYYVIDHEIPETQSIPLGFSCGNQDVFLLDENDELCPQGEAGEICVKSPTLAIGYYNDPERTAQVFVQNPLQKAYREIIYRTGDLGRVNERGELVLLGRKDFQIKHMGHRIELGEIETAASSLNGIDRCCALYNKEKDRIVLFYTGKIDNKAVKAGVKGLVPDYMVPTKVIQLDEMPMNLNGKIHRQELMKQL